MLMNSKQLTGGDEPKFLPKIYVVNGECCLFLNAARRIAYGTEYPIEVVTIEDAWEIHTGLSRDTLNKNEVEWTFNNTGNTYNGRLYCNNYLLQAGGVPNPVVKLMSNKKVPSEILDVEVNRLFLGVRAQNIMTYIGCKTYGDLLKFGRDKLMKVRNVGLTTLGEFDAEMDRIGLLNQWKYNKPVN